LIENCKIIKLSFKEACLPVGRDPPPAKKFFLTFKLKFISSTQLLKIDFALKEKQ